MTITRRKTKTIKIGNIKIGANNPIAIQSMVKVKTSCIEKAVKQIQGLERAGCEIVRLAIRDSQDAQAIKRIKSFVKLPIVADIHFNWRLAIEAIDNGADKIRLNPGNIYKQEQIKEIAAAAGVNRVPIRVGVNSGSLRMGDRCKVLGVRKSLKPKTYNLRPNISDFMVQSTLNYIKILEGFGFYDIVISLKSSDIFDTIAAYRKMARLCDYPFHLGVTATGASYSGAIKSSIVLGVLLMEGIGDTIRVSLTDKPEQEIRAAKAILESLWLRHFGPEIISCPTCGRCEVDLVKIVKELEDKLSTFYSLLSTPPMKLAVMGCEVNGPGEARQADIGIAFGRKEGLLFSKGKQIKKVSTNKCIDVLLEEINKCVSL